MKRETGTDETVPDFLRNDVATGCRLQKYVHPHGRFQTALAEFRESFPPSLFPLFSLLNAGLGCSGHLLQNHFSSPLSE